MAKDVVITPASGLIDFKNASNVSVATISLSDTGQLSLGNTASNVYIGDGTTSVDIIFEQNGKIRALTGKTLTLGQSDSSLNVAAPVTYTSPDASKTITATMLNAGSLSFTGSTGQLLSVTNSFTGTIFSANDVSGIPSIEVLDTGVIKLGQYGGNVLLGTGVDDGVNKLQVNGYVKATGIIEQTTTISSTTATTTIDLSTITNTTIIITCDTTASQAKVFNFTGTPSTMISSNIYSINVIVKNNVAIASLTWQRTASASNIKWPSGTVPPATLTVIGTGGYDVWTFFTTDGGTTFAGSLAMYGVR
jgi:hypothetical protein